MLSYSSPMFSNFVVNSDLSPIMYGDKRGESHNWKEYLNWATEDNPDGVPIVHKAMDQGLCGSCWVSEANNLDIFFLSLRSHLSRPN